EPVSFPELKSLGTEKPQFSRQKDLPLQQILELKPLEQKDLIKFIELNAQKMERQYCQQDKDGPQESSVSKASSPGSEAPHSDVSLQGHGGDKWQYLHRELSWRVTLPVPQPVEPQVAINMSMLPSVSVYNFKYPTTEELKVYTTQLEDLRQEASNLQAQEDMTEETYSSLDKRLFELLLGLSRCLGSVGELLRNP
uniref:Uncharacterized protein n=2 Tax=Jaculus jaculus TaxID=51337 RepID=A0A8C5L4W7_JACJA